MQRRLEDIAKELNLSTATVSRALSKNTEHLVKKETRDKILDYVKKTGFKPNIKARGLASGKLTNLFFILSQNEASIFYDQYFFNVMQGIHSVIMETEYSLVILPVKNEYTEDQIYDVLLNNETAGLILSPYCSHLDFPFDVIKGYNFPVLLLDDEERAENAYVICQDNEQAGFDGAELLWNKGYRSFVLVSDVRHSEHSELRKKGFFKFFDDKKESGYAIDHMELLLSYTSAEPVLNEIEKIKERPVGVFALNDEIAVGIINHLAVRQIKCPGDIGVVGFDGLYIGQHALPRLNSVAFPFKEIGKKAAEVLIGAMEGKEMPHKTVISPTITDGESC